MGTRSQGRAADQMRKVEIEAGYLKHAEGSALIRMGDTVVLCAASVEQGVPAFMEEGEGGWITAEYALLPRSTHTRTPRESSRGNIGGRTHEIQRVIGRSMRSVVDLSFLGPHTIRLDCDVIQADGGTRTAAITGAYVALHQAVRFMKESGLIARDPIKEQVAAISVGLVEGQMLLDLDYAEDSRAEVDMNVVMTASGKLVEIQGTAERSPFSVQELSSLVKMAEKGIRELIAIQKASLPSK